MEQVSFDERGVGRMGYYIGKQTYNDHQGGFSWHLMSETRL